MKHHKTGVLHCKVEKAVEDAGSKVLWTPPYWLDLQTIELYWSAGNVNVSRNYYFGLSVKSKDSDLRDGWYGNKHRTTSGKMDMRVPEDEDTNIVIEVKKVDCFKLIKKSIKCAKNHVAAIPGIFGSVDGDLHIYADYCPTNVPATSIPIDTLVNTALNTEDDEDEHKYTNGWDIIFL